MKRIVSLFLVLAIVFGLIPWQFESEALSETKIWDGSIASFFDGGSGTQDDPYRIATAEQLAYFSASVNAGTTYSGQYVVLTEDIYLNDTADFGDWINQPPKNKWTPIGTSSSIAFRGVFDGNGHQIQGMYVENKSLAGLFGYIRNAMVKNLYVSKAHVTGSTVGGIVAYIYRDSGSTTLIENITYEGIASSYGSYAGGIYGTYTKVGSSTCNISNCNVYGAVIGETNVGGIGGKCASIIDCNVNAQIVGTEAVGGIAGTVEWGTRVINCAAYGSIQGKTQVGGIVGYQVIGEVNCCSNFATIQGTSEIGGIIGKGWSNASITQCYNKGNVKGSSYVGGVIGYLHVGGEVANCYNTGTVSGTSSYLGGISGRCFQNGASVTKCYNTGAVNNGNKSGVCEEAWLGGSVTYSYYRDDCGSGGYGVALTGNQMTEAAFFEGFDFDSVWIISDLVNRPVLINNPEKMADVSCQITVLDISTGEYVSGANITYNNTTVTTDDYGTAIITAPGQEYISQNHLIVKKEEYNDFICFLSDLSVSFDALPNNTIFLIPTNASLTTEYGKQIYLIDHVSFYQEDLQTMVNDFGFYNTVWQYENGKRLWACYTWDILGDLGEVATLKFDDLVINADYYDLYVADLILALVETQTLNDEAFLTKAADVYQETFKTFKEHFVENLATIIIEQNGLQEEVEDMLAEHHVSISELIANKELLKSDLEKILQGNGADISPQVKVLYKAVCGKALKDDALFAQLFSGFELANEISSIYTDTMDIIKDVGNAYIISESCMVVNNEIFKILSETAQVMRSNDDSVYATRFLDSVNKYAKIATDKDAFRRYILFESGISLIFNATSHFRFDNLIKDNLYNKISSVFGITPLQLKVLVGTYNGTYKLLDRITKLSDKNEQYYIMSYVGPVETALSQVVASYGDKMVASQDFESAQSFDLAYQALRFTNKYLYESAHNFAALQKDTEETQYATYYKNIWNLTNCHGNYLIDRSKYVSIACPGDVYLYDANDELVVAIVDNEVLTYTDTAVTVSVCDDRKTVIFSADSDYDIEIKGTNTGTLSIDYTETASDEFTCERLVYFDNIEVDEDSGFDFQITADSNDMLLTDQDNETILPNFDNFATFEDLTFKSVSLSLENTIAINYKVEKSVFENLGYTDPYAVFEVNGVQTKVSDYYISGDRYVFVCRNMASNQMNDTVKATLYATCHGVECSGITEEISIAEYCYRMLELCSDDAYAELRTLLVDLLHYGAAAQLYTSYKTDTLADASLTPEQLLWGTQDDPELNNVLNKTYETVENPEATWGSTHLNLGDSVTPFFSFGWCGSYQDVTLKIESSDTTWILTADDITWEDTNYPYYDCYLYFSELNASQMRESIYLTVCKNGVPVSDTLRYSIESYACAMIDKSSDPQLVALLKAMMRYGDSAYNFVH